MQYAAAVYLYSHKETGAMLCQEWQRLISSRDIDGEGGHED